MLLVRDDATGELHPCPEGSCVVVGRKLGGGVGLACDDKHVSRRHCELRCEPDGTLAVVDLSTYGTFVNGVRIETRGSARPGDRLTLGHDYVLTVLDRPAREDETHDDATDARTEAGRARAAPPAWGGELVAIGTRYRVLREIGRGGMGVVYEAWDETQGARCAIKRLLACGDAPPELLRRFEREASLSARLGRHPGIVEVLELGKLPGTGELYCVMELVDGAPLSRLIRGGVSRCDGVRIVAETARAIAHAHERGVIHRDLKPANVLVTRDGRAKVIDFGIAKALDEGSGLTATGVLLGTPAYEAPEQIDDAKRAGPAADVYSLGAILYAVLTGGPPYPGKQIHEVLVAIQKGALVPPAERDPTIDPALDRICLRCLAVEPERRPASAAALADELEAWLASDGEAGRPASHS